MTRTLPFTGFLAAALAVTGTASAQPSMPNEFESASATLNPLFSYFGGVNGFGAEFDALTEVHSGASLRVFANFQPDPFFTTAGFAIGANNISGALLNVDPGVDTFSLSVSAPSEGVLSFYVTIREDDDADGVASAASNDDQWESPDVFLTAGTNVYNIPAADFILANEGNGNGAQNFGVTPVMSVIVTFETKQSYPGGIIEIPVSFHIDHLGFFVGPQELPGSGQPADLNGDGVVNGADLAELLAQFGGAGSADLNNDGVVDGADLAAMLANWS